MSLRYDSQKARDFSRGEKYSLAGTLTLPWRAADLSLSGRAGRASDHDAVLGRAWSTSSSGSVHLRVRANLDIAVSGTRTVPAVGSASSYSSASLVQRF